MATFRLQLSEETRKSPPRIRSLSMGSCLAPPGRFQRHVSETWRQRLGEHRRLNTPPPWPVTDSGYIVAEGLSPQTRRSLGGLSGRPSPVFPGRTQPNHCRLRRRAAGWHNSSPQAAILYAQFQPRALQVLYVWGFVADLHSTLVFARAWAQAGASFRPVHWRCIRERFSPLGRSYRCNRRQRLSASVASVLLVGEPEELSLATPNAPTASSSLPPPESPVWFGGPEWPKQGRDQTMAWTRTWTNPARTPLDLVSRTLSFSGFGADRNGSDSQSKDSDASETKKYDRVAEADAPQLGAVPAGSGDPQAAPPADPLPGTSGVGFSRCTADHQEGL